ncbi:MAG: GNAT family N-acetyltransferase [Gemmatimonas sp.]
MSYTFQTPRIATRDDGSHLVTVINRAYVAESSIVRGERIDLSNVVQRIVASNTWFLVIEQNTDHSARQIVACVCLDCDGHRGHIGLLSVDPDHQGRGLGAKLLRAAELLCAEKFCCPVIELEVVSERHDLFPFYAQMGYERTGVAPFPNESLLKKPAHMVVMQKRSSTCIQL